MLADYSTEAPSRTYKIRAGWHAQIGYCFLLATALSLLASTAAKAAICTVNATGMAFGSYDPLAAAPLESTSTVQVTCMSEAPPRVRYRVALSTGQAGSYNTRAMTNGVSQLNYNLYLNAARTTIWGDGTGGTRVIRRRYNLPPPGSTQTDTHIVYGRVFAGQMVTVGTYLDTITVTVRF